MGQEDWKRKPADPEVKEAGVRLNKFLSEAGVCSRREADRLAEAGEITVDGRRAEPGTRVFPGQRVAVSGREIAGRDRPVLLAVYKPRGVVCTTSDRDRAQNIVEFLHYPVRVYPVGRLDKDSEGLILMTNEGELVNRILRARHGHEKEDLVTVDRPVTEEFLARMRAGVPILDTVTRPCTAEKTGERSFRIILTQGLNRQIRRMCEALGWRVRSLKRIRVLNIRLGEMKAGEWREVAGAERAELLRLLENTGGSERAGGSTAGRTSGNENGRRPE